MSPDDLNEQRGFTVQDRRRFAGDGEPRPAAPGPEAATQPADDRPAGPTPPPVEITLSTFVLSLSTQALAYLGEIPHPGNTAVSVDLEAAKQLIDILGILDLKTKGNLDTSEAELLEHVLYDLRLRYVECVRANRQTTTR